jgi:predicted ribosome quality control (RQC) complex YloA/Tae2 family protein
MAVDQLDAADEEALIEAIDSLVTPLKEGAVQPMAAVDQQERLLALAPYPLEHLGTQRQITFSSMSELMAFSGRYYAPPAIPGKDALRSVVTGEQSRLQRKEGILGQELAESQDADAYRRCGDLLMASLPLVAEGSAQVQLPDLFAETAEQPLVTVKLDPLLSPLKNAQHYYSRYNKAKRAQESLTEQLNQCRADLQYLDSVAVALEYAATAAEVSDIRQELVDAGYLKAPAKRRAAVAASQPQTAVTSDNVEVLIGRNNRQNDLITFKRSHHDDIWLHTKDIPGSHVILRTGAAEPSPAALQEAAQLAAYFSKARQSARVPVDYARRRHVKKPAGAKPGFVIYDHQSTLYVTPEEHQVKAALERRKKNNAEG